jgi:hypothetical protein
MIIHLTSARAKSVSCSDLASLITQELGAAASVEQVQMLARAISGLPDASHVESDGEVTVPARSDD